MKLTPEHKRLLAEMELAGNDSRNAIFTAGYRAGVEASAKVADAQIATHDRLQAMADFPECSDAHNSGGKWSSGLIAAAIRALLD